MSNTAITIKNGRLWSGGPPPHIGWWNASVGYSTYVWRWWDGYGWSEPVHETLSSESAAVGANRKLVAGKKCNILWSDYWPENARVQRVDPCKVD